MIGEMPRDGTPRNRARLVERLDHMVESGQLTDAEAARIRAATNEGEVEEAIRSIRVRHAGVGLKEAVESGDMAQEQADSYLERLQNGEHLPSIRARLRQLRSRHNKPGDASAGHEGIND
jgi:polyhydroxyalkanoate synthesis regulator phasin